MRFEKSIKYFSTKDERRKGHQTYERIGNASKNAREKSRSVNRAEKFSVYKQQYTPKYFKKIKREHNV